jgi:hypothetical protein
LEIQLSEYNRSIQKELGLKKTPILTIEVYENETDKVPEQVKLFGY